MEHLPPERLLTPAPRLALPVRPDTTPPSPPQSPPPAGPSYWWNDAQTKSLRRCAQIFGGCTILVFLLLWVYQDPFANLFSRISHAFAFFIGNYDIQGWVMQSLEQLYLFLAYPLAFLPPYLLYARLTRFSAREIPRQTPHPPVLFSSVGLAMGASLAGTVITFFVLMVLAFLGLGPGDVNIYLPSTTPAIFLFCVNMTIVPAIVEEYIYRGIVLQSLRRYGDGLALIVSSLFFGLMHQNFLQLPHATILGFAIGYLVLQTGSIYTGMVIHFINNLVATLQLLAQESLMEDWQIGLLSLGQLAFYFIAMVVALLYLCLARKVRWRLPRAQHTPPLRRSAGVFFGSPLVIALLIISGILLIFSAFNL